MSDTVSDTVSDTGSKTKIRGTDKLSPFKIHIPVQGEEGYDPTTPTNRDEGICPSAIKLICALGVKDVVNVTKRKGDYDDDVHFRAVDGRTRVRCARWAYEDLVASGYSESDALDRVMVPVKSHTGDALRLAYLEVIGNNVRRGKANPMEIAAKVSELIEMGGDVEIISASFNMSVADTKRYLKLLDLHAASQRYVRQGDIGLTAAYNLLSIGDKVLQEAAAKEAAENGGSIKATAAAVTKRGGKPPSKGAETTKKPYLPPSKGLINSILKAVTSDEFIKMDREKPTDRELALLRWVTGNDSVENTDAICPWFDTAQEIAGTDRRTKKKEINTSNIDAD